MKITSDDINQLKKLFILFQTEYVSLDQDQSNIILDILNKDIDLNIKHKLLDIVGLIKSCFDHNFILGMCDECNNDLVLDIKKSLSHLNHQVEIKIESINIMLEELSKDL